MLAPIIAIHGRDLRFLKSWLDYDDAISHSDDSVLEMIVAFTPVELKDVRDLGVILITGRNIEHFQRVEAKGIVALRLQCMDDGKIQVDCLELVEHSLRNAFDT